MGLLKSVNNVPGIDFYEYRDQNYYGKYCYRVRFKMPTVRYIINEKNVEGLMKRYNAVSGWRVIKAQDRPAVTKDIEALKQLIELRNTFKKEGTATVRLEWDSVAVFSNDLSLLKNIESIKPELEYNYTQTQTTTFVGVKTFVKEPKHKYRIYFKSKMIEDGFVTQLYDLIKRSSEMHPSTSLNHWLRSYHSSYVFNWKYRYTNSHHFIDYDDESVLSYLALMHGEILGKRYKLEKRPEAI